MSHSKSSHMQRIVRSAFTTVQRAAVARTSSVNIRAAMLRTHTLFVLLAAAFFALGTSRAFGQTDNVFVGYYGSGSVSEFTTMGGTSTTLTGGTVFAPGFVAEGISCLMGASGQNSSELYVSNFNTGEVAIFSTDKTELNTNFLKTSTGATMKLQEIAGSAFSSDGHTLYVAASGGGPGGSGAIYSFSTMPSNFGEQTGVYAFAGAHDVTFYDGYLYASAFDVANTGVYRILPVLSPAGSVTFTAPTKIVAQSAATGITFINNDMYVGNFGGSNSTSAIDEYAISPSLDTIPTSVTASPIANYTGSASLLDNPIGLTTGPDNNIYIACLGDSNFGGSNEGQVTELDQNLTDPTYGTFSTYVPVTGYNYAAEGDNPKYVDFESNCTIYQTNTNMPEPSALALALISSSTLLIRRRRCGPVSA